MVGGPPGLPVVSPVAMVSRIVPVAILPHKMDEPIVSDLIRNLVPCVHVLRQPMVSVGVVPIRVVSEHRAPTIQAHVVRPLHGVVLDPMVVRPRVVV